MQKNSTHSEKLGPSSWVGSSFSLSVSFAPVLVSSERQRTRAQVGDVGRSVLGDVAPVTGPRRAVTHCDRACTNPQVLRYPDRCSLSATTAAALSSSPSFVRNVSRPCRSCAPASHTPPTDPREPSSLHQPAPRTLLRAVLPALPTQLRLLRGQNIFDFETCPIKSLNPPALHKKGG